jgi:hypothetical protein
VTWAFARCEKLISYCKTSTAGQARDSCAEIGFKNRVNYNDLLITSVSTSLVAVPNFLCTTSDRVRLPELRQANSRTPPREKLTACQNYSHCFSELCTHQSCQQTYLPTYKELEQTTSAVETCSLANTAVLVLLKAAFLYSHAAINSGWRRGP